MNKYSFIVKLANIFQKYSSDFDEIEFLKKRVGPLNKDSFDKPINEKEHMLMRHNIIPIVSSKLNDYDEMHETSVLGYGDSSYVYEVLFNGKVCAAKVAHNEQEIYVLNLLKNIKPNFGELGKHLPIVYSIFKDGIYHVAIVEKLLPINSNIKNMLFNDDRVSPNKMNTLKDASTLNRILNQLVEPINFSKETNKKIKNAIYIILRREDFSNISKQGSAKYLNELIQKILITTDVIAKNDPNYNKNILMQMLDSLRSSLDLLMRHIIFPDNGVYQDKDQMIISQALPESRSLMKALTKLKDKYNITWQDLHGANIMERPETKDLVISDPGAFEY